MSMIVEYIAQGEREKKTKFVNGFSSAQNTMYIKLHPFQIDREIAFKS